VTTDLNCVDAAFNEYAARRDAGETPEQAYANLGLYFGDDSVFSAKIATAVIAVSERLGMRMTLEEKVPNAPAGRVVFLSRVYPDIQTSIASYPCMIRALRKMRVATPGKGATERELSVLRVLKGEAALLVNGHVPIIGPYAAVLAASGSAVTVRERENALNRNGDLRWQLGTRAPTTVLSGSEVDLFVASIARDLCIPPEEVRRMDAELRRANTLTDLMPIRLAGWEVSQNLNLNVEMKSPTHISVKSFNREKIQSDCQNGGRGAPRNRTAILSSKLTRKLALSQVPKWRPTLKISVRPKPRKGQIKREQMRAKKWERQTVARL
jgi:hypothetical protein